MDDTLCVVTSLRCVMGMVCRYTLCSDLSRGDRMCGRYTLTSPEDIAARFGLGALAETRIEPRFNVAPSQPVPVIVARDDGPKLTTMRWGFQPAWMRTNGQRPPPINARSESLLE